MIIPDQTETPAFLVVAAALVSPERRVFVQQRFAGAQHGGLWEFPGGKVERGETPEAALARELHEELGITVSADAMRPLSFATVSADGRHLVLLLYFVQSWSGEPRAITAATARWLEVESLGDLPMPPADRPLVRVLARELTPNR